MFACRFLAASAARSAAPETPGRDGPGRRGGGVGQWLATLAATAVSTYALDLVATTAGVALAASQILGGADHGLLLAFLVCTYVTWAAGLRLNLAANWTLLEETGTSTNALSKAAYELLAAREPAGAPDRLGARLRRHRDRQGGALLRRRLRSRASLGLGVVRRRDRLPRRRQPRRRRLRVRSRARDARVREITARLRLVRHRMGATRVPRRLLQRGRARRARDDRILRRRDARGPARRAGPVLRRRTHAAPRVPRGRKGLGDPPGRLPAGQPRRDSSAGSTASPTPTTGARSSATRSSARALPRRPTSRSASARRSRARRSRACSRSTPATRRRCPTATRRS